MKFKDRISDAFLFWKELRVMAEMRPKSLPTLAERRRPAQQRALTLSAAIAESEQRSERREAAVQNVARRIFEQLQSVMREPNISTASAARRLSRRVSVATAAKTAASLAPPWEREKTVHLDPARAAEVFGGYDSWKVILDSADTDGDGFVDEEEWVQYVLESAREEGFSESQASLAAMLADLAASPPSPCPALVCGVGVGAHPERSSKLNLLDIAAEAVAVAEEGSGDDDSTPSPMHDSAYTAIRSSPTLSDAGMSPSRSLPSSPQAGQRTVRRNLSSEPIGALLTPSAAPRPPPPAAGVLDGGVSDAARAALVLGDAVRAATTAADPSGLESPPDTPPMSSSLLLPTAPRAQSPPRPPPQVPPRAPPPPSLPISQSPPKAPPQARPRPPLQFPSRAPLQRPHPPPRPPPRPPAERVSVAAHVARVRGDTMYDLAERRGWEGPDDLHVPGEGGDESLRAAPSPPGGSGSPGPAR